MAYLGLWQTFVMELFCENSERILAVGDRVQSGLFPGKIAATVYSLTIQFEENNKDIFICRRCKTVGGSLNFEILA